MLVIAELDCSWKLKCQSDIGSTPTTVRGSTARTDPDPDPLPRLGPRGALENPEPEGEAD